MINNILNSIAYKRRILILTHNNPDPDAMAAAFAFKFLIHKVFNKRATIAYMGMIGRLENRELVKQCKIDMVQSFDFNFARFDHIIVVDTQPQAGNVYLPDQDKVNTIIDHHLSRKAVPKRKDLIADIKPDYGSTSTIIAEYLKKLEIVPDLNVATALYFGITTDAIGKARDSSQVDKDMLGYIFPYLSLQKIAKIENPDLPRYHFKTLRKAIEKAVLIDKLLFCNLDDVRNSDLIAETADYMLRMRELNCVFIIGKVENVAMFSLRYKSRRKSIGRIAMRIVKDMGYGGGHMRSAGGQVPLTKLTYDEVVSTLKQRLLKSLAIKNAEEKSI